MSVIRPGDQFLEQPFWRHLATGILHLNRCDACRTFRHPPGPICPKCRSFGGRWVPASGRAVLHSFTTVHHPVHPGLGPWVPYVVTLVDLEEGVRMVSGIPGGRNYRLEVGMALQCEVVRFDERFALPYFIPIDGEQHDRSIEQA